MREIGDYHEIRQFFRGRDGIRDNSTRYSHALDQLPK